MTQPLRPYQANAIKNTYAEWRAGKRRVLLVAPTGAGKTRLAEEVVLATLRKGRKVLFVVHRRELMRQAATRLRSSLGIGTVGIISPGEDASPVAPVQIATVQTLLARDMRPEADLIILDEAHHYVATEWLAVHEHYSQALVIGLTATPERQDGTALGDVFESLVVAAKYSELVADGYLVPCRAFQPPTDLGSDLALDPVEAWQRYAEGSQTFAFMPSVQGAIDTAEAFRAAGITSAVVHGKQSRLERDTALDDFAAGRVTVLCNFNVLTEGVDVPAARCLLIARSFQHCGSYMQAGGRVLRPHPSKPDAIIIDLTGATHRHGFPTDDRAYSLEGKGISREAITPLRQCLQCGATLPAVTMQCPECGYVFTKRDPRIVQIYSYELREAFAGADTPSDAMAKEYVRLRELQRSKGWGLYFVTKEYRKLFGSDPVFIDATPEEQALELAKLRAIAAERGFKPGYVGVRYRAMFGSYPSR